jgi:integrase
MSAHQQNNPKDLARAITAWLSQTSPRSHPVMIAALRKNLELMGKDPDLNRFDWSTIEHQDILHLKSVMMPQYSPSTINRHISALRGILKAYWRLGYISSDHYYKTIDVPGVEIDTLPSGRILQDNEVRLLLQTCDQEYQETNKLIALRDGAIIAVMYTTGMRQEEISKIHAEDVNIATGEISIRFSKYNRQRTSYIKGNALNRLVRWINARSGHTCPALFLAFTKNGKIARTPIQSAHTIYVMLKRRAMQAGIEDFSPHDLRRTAISNLLDEADLSTTAQIVGHASVNTTRRYVGRSEQPKEQASEYIDNVSFV